MIRSSLSLIIRNSLTIILTTNCRRSAGSSNVGRDWIIFDVGADVGCYSILFSRLAPEGAVYACEPTNTIQLLRRNLGHHRADNVRTLRTAVGTVTGQIEKDIYRIRGRTPERTVCDFTTIDDLSRQLKLERVDCIKLDAGGFDLEALQGAERTLDRLNPWIVVSLDHTLTTRSHSLGEALEWLAARGYRAPMSSITTIMSCGGRSARRRRLLVRGT